jgi:hypothetical protein
MSFPAYVQTAEDMRRHELVVRAALITFGWDTDDESTVLDHNDR